MHDEIDKIAKLLNEGEMPILRTEFIKIPEILFNRYRPEVILEVLKNRDGRMALQILQHVMFAMRKAGMVEYPDEEEFELSYNQSGMYTSGGGYSPSIKPGESAMVRVIEKGWGFSYGHGEGIKPVRKAVVEII